MRRRLGLSTYGLTAWGRDRIPTLYFTKIPGLFPDFPGTPRTFSRRERVTQQLLKNKDESQFLTLYISYSVTVQSIAQRPSQEKRNCSVSNFAPIRVTLNLILHIYKAVKEADETKRYARSSTISKFQDFPGARGPWREMSTPRTLPQ